MWTKQVTDMIIAGVGETLYMTLFSTFFGYVFGMPLGILLKVSDKEGLRPNAVLYKILDVIANIFRSIPFLILLILVLSFAYMIWFLLHQKTVEQLKDDFTHNVTHELKTPIAISYAAIESIIHYNLLGNKEKADKYLHLCHEELERLGGMVEQILTLSLEKRKEIRLVMEDISLNALIGKILEQQKIKSSRPFCIRVESVPEEITLKADRVHLYSIISNLVDNAVKYADKEPEITIRAEAAGGKVQLRVQDNGPGIPEEYRRHLFDKFYRLPSSRHSQVKGYGIGLFYVKTMVEKHGGTVIVESVSGQGSCFIVTLPQ